MFTHLKHPLSSSLPIFSLTFTLSDRKLVHINPHRLTSHRCTWPNIHRTGIHMDGEREKEREREHGELTAVWRASRRRRRGKGQKTNRIHIYHWVDEVRVNVEREKTEGERKSASGGRSAASERGGCREGWSRIGCNKAPTGRVIPRYVTDGTTGCLMGSLRSSLVYQSHAAEGRKGEERRDDTGWGYSQVRGTARGIPRPSGGRMIYTKHKVTSTAIGISL